MSARRLIRQTMTIARRDFIATVFTPIFLLFLFAPLIMVAFSTIGARGGRGATVARHPVARARYSGAGACQFRGEGL